MTAAGWFIMLVSLTCVLGLASYCLIKVLSLPAPVVEEHLQTQPFIDTKDTDAAD